MKLNRIPVIAFLFLSFMPLNVFARQGPRMLSGNRSISIVEAGKVYSMAEFTPRMPLKIEIQGPGKLIVYIKTAIPERYRSLPAFRLFVKKDDASTNQYLFPVTTHSNASFEGIKNYNPSAQMNSIPIDVPEGMHTYELYLSQSPYIIGLASFGYAPLETGTAPATGIRRITREGPYGYTKEEGHGKSFYIQPYGMVGDVYEQGTNNDSIYAGAGANVDIFITGKIALSSMINYTDADQEYLIWRNLPLPLGAGMYVVNEQTLLLHALLSYVLLHTNRNIIMIGAGWGDLELINDAFPGEVNGPVVGALIKLGLSESTSLNIRPSYMQDVFNTAANTNSILGTPYSLLLYPAGLAFNIMPGVSMEIGYDGRLLTFQNTSRFYNGGFIAAVF